MSFHADTNFISGACVTYCYAYMMLGRHECRASMKISCHFSCWHVKPCQGMEITFKHIDFCFRVKYPRQVTWQMHDVCGKFDIGLISGLI